MHYHCSMAANSQNNDANNSHASRISRKRGRPRNSGRIIHQSHEMFGKDDPSCIIARPLIPVSRRIAEILIQRHIRHMQRNDFVLSGYVTPHEACMRAHACSCAHGANRPLNRDLKISDLTFSEVKI